MSEQVHLRYKTDTFSILSRHCNNYVTARYFPYLLIYRILHALQFKYHDIYTF